MEFAFPFVYGHRQRWLFQVEWRSAELPDLHPRPSHTYTSLYAAMKNIQTGTSQNSKEAKVNIKRNSQPHKFNYRHRHVVLVHSSKRHGFILLSCQFHLQFLFILISLRLFCVWYVTKYQSKVLLFSYASNGLVCTCQPLCCVGKLLRTSGNDHALWGCSGTLKSPDARAHHCPFHEWPSFQQACAHICLNFRFPFCIFIFHLSRW